MEVSHTDGFKPIDSHTARDFHIYFTSIQIYKILLMKGKIMFENSSHKNSLSIFSIICGAVYALISFLIRINTKNQFELIHIINCEDIFPPIWLFNFLGILFAFLLGFSAGLIIDDISFKKCNTDGELNAYRGGLLFVSTFFLSLIWYPLFFSGEYFLFALLISLLAAIAAIFNGIFWISVKSISGILAIISSLWLFYVFIINVLVIFNN